MEARFDIFESPTAAKFAKRFFGAAQLLEGSALPKTLRELVLLRVSQINGCAPCVDMHTKEALEAGETALRLNMLVVWREAMVYTDAERAAFALAEEGTRLADAHEGVSDETWAAARKHFDDDELGTLIAVIATINAANRFNVIVRKPGGDYDPELLKSMSSSMSS